MRFTRIRWFRALVAATFLWSNVAVAAHACIAALAAQAQDAVAMQEHEGCAHEQPAPAGPANGDQALCLAHCLQADQATTQKISIDVPGVVFAPVLFVLHPSVQAAPIAPVLALAVPVVGPPLTILLRNFRI
jgi:hypothetical protein